MIIQHELVSIVSVFDVTENRNWNKNRAILPRENVRVMRALESPLQFVQLEAGEGSPVATLFSTLARIVLVACGLSTPVSIHDVIIFLEVFFRCLLSGRCVWNTALVFHNLLPTLTVRQTASCMSLNPWQLAYARIPQARIKVTSQPTCSSTRLWRHVNAG